MKTRNTTYISIDIEADGTIPGLGSMLQLGAAAFDLKSTQPRLPIGTFSANLELLPGVTPSPSTILWWASQGDAYANTRTNLETPQEAMARFVAWVRTFRNPVLIGYPVTYDFLWVYWYTLMFGGIRDGERCPFGFQGLDLKTLAAEKMSVPYSDATKRNMPSSWFVGVPPHTHDALDDALGQGIMFVNMVSDNPRGAQNG